jgi:hypothetical protein
VGCVVRGLVGLKVSKSTCAHLTVPSPGRSIGPPWLVLIRNVDHAALANTAQFQALDFLQFLYCEYLMLPFVTQLLA